MEISTLWLQNCCDGIIINVKQERIKLPGKAVKKGKNCGYFKNKRQFVAFFERSSGAQMKKGRFHSVWN